MDVNNRIYTSVVNGNLISTSQYVGHVITKKGLVGFATDNEGLTRLFTSYKGRYYEKRYDGRGMCNDKTLIVRANKLMVEVLEDNDEAAKGEGE